MSVLEVGLGDELHRYGWNACSSALKHEDRDMSGLAQRFLLVPGLRSFNIYVLDTRRDPRNPTLHKTIPGRELESRILAAVHTAVRPRRASSSPVSGTTRRTERGQGGSRFRGPDDKMICS